MKIDIKSLVVFENNDFFILNKPSGIAVLDDRQSTLRNGLLEMARLIWPDCQVCHRLDKETSGALAFAKHADAYRHLAMQFENREVGKMYHALVEGAVNWEEHLMEWPLFISSSGNVKVDRAGKPSATWVRTLSIFGNYTLVECMPITGRMHQIRVHLSFEKKPIVGDHKYGGKDLFLSEVKRKFHLGRGKDERPMIARVALHAFKIRFKGMKDELIESEAAYPKDFAVLLKQLEKACGIQN